MENQFKINSLHIEQICETAKSHGFDLIYVNCMNYKGTKILYFKLENYEMYENDKLQIHVKGDLFFFKFVIIRHSKVDDRFPVLATMADVKGLDKALKVVDEYFKELSIDKYK